MMNGNNIKIKSRKGNLIIEVKTDNDNTNELQYFIFYPIQLLIVDCGCI